MFGFPTFAVRSWLGQARLMTVRFGPVRFRPDPWLMKGLSFPSFDSSPKSNMKSQPRCWIWAEIQMLCTQNSLWLVCHLYRWIVRVHSFNLLKEKIKNQKLSKLKGHSSLNKIAHRETTGDFGCGRYRFNHLTSTTSPSGVLRTYKRTCQMVKAQKRMSSNLSLLVTCVNAKIMRLRSPRFTPAFANPGKYISGHCNGLHWWATSKWLTPSLKRFPIFMECRQA